jgi:hypothetical protein
MILILLVVVVTAVYSGKEAPARPAGAEEFRRVQTPR